NGAPTELRCGVGLAASTPRRYGERRRGGTGSTRRTRCAGRREMCGSRPETAGGRIRAGDLHALQLASTQTVDGDGVVASVRPGVAVPGGEAVGQGEAGGRRQ